MLSINGLHNFYYLPELHDMRCKAQRICEIIRGRYHRDPLNGDVYMFMSKDQRKVRMIVTILFSALTRMFPKPTFAP